MLDEEEAAKAPKEAMEEATDKAEEREGRRV